MKKSAELYRKTDVLVIGNGLAGMSSAYSAAQKGLDVLLVSRSSDCHGSGSAYAQGGIIYRAKQDSLDDFIDDFQEAGDGIANNQAIKQIYNHGKDFIDNILIDDVGVQFDRDENGNIDLAQEAAHSVARIAHIKDYTGRAIQEAFAKKVHERSNITVINNATAIDLITLSHHAIDYKLAYKPTTCKGAYILFQDKNEVRPIMAKQTILATGGLGRIYLHTSNPKGIRGDGYAMSYRVGARIMNMEYVQFHPTTLYTEGEERFLITEAIRGEGGVLRNQAGEAFMENYHELGSLAPRDIVAQSIVREMTRNNASYVYLDITSKSKKWIENRFPTVYKECEKKGINPATEGIPVVPAAHYECGGVAVNQVGRTTIKGLKAVGEVSCTGLHGANRLASSSLLECLVYGTLAGRDAYERIKEEDFIEPKIIEWKEEEEPVEEDLLQEDWMIVRHTMWNYAGIIRTERKLDRAKGIFQLLKGDIEEFYAHSKLRDDLIGLRNAVTSAKLVLHAAELNRKSQGCHYRKD